MRPNDNPHSHNVHSKAKTGYENTVGFISWDSKQTESFLSADSHNNKVSRIFKSLLNYY